ncbi:hypothetical protein [Marinobacterium sp. BA1]|uniref:hypothetical protein n=1 Tax=Marinobacterium sp. BA1 TaxID=3138931 RepID=UPI0032E5AD6A
MSRKEFDKRINSDEIAGRAIRLCAIFEDRLNNILAEYFALRDRWGDFHEHFLERMSLIQKLDLLQKLDFGSGSKSRTNFVTSLKSLRKLRNVMAHNYSLHNEEELSKLYSDENIRKWVLNYPKSFSDEKRNMEVRTTKLWKFANATRKS